MFSQTKTITALALVAATMLPSLVQATPFTFLPRKTPCIPGVSDSGCRLPTPDEVSGKEYSNHVDVDDTQPIPVADPEQTLAWDGIGGREDGLDYSGSRGAAFSPAVDGQVDAMANRGDLFFQEVRSDEVWMIFSTGTYGAATVTDRDIYVEVPGAPLGGLWATGAEVDIDANNDLMEMAGTVANPMNVDALEVWCTDGGAGADADTYSLIGDTVVETASGRRVSVFDYAGGASSAAFYRDELLAAVLGLTGLAGQELADLEEFFDVDAMMVDLFDQAITFSIAPIALTGGGGAMVFDGGEIFTWDRLNGGPAAYLVHGGHVWDTAFDVMGTFGTQDENVNALEGVSVPVPASLALSLIGLLGLRSLRKRG